MLMASQTSILVIIQTKVSYYYGSFIQTTYQPNYLHIFLFPRLFVRAYCERKQTVDNKNKIISCYTARAIQCMNLLVAVLSFQGLGMYQAPAFCIDNIKTFVASKKTRFFYGVIGLFVYLQYRFVYCLYIYYLHEYLLKQSSLNRERLLQHQKVFIICLSIIFYQYQPIQTNHVFVHI